MVSVNRWDEETDVIIIGYGLSGAVAAIEAHDGGAEVSYPYYIHNPLTCSKAPSLR